MNDCEHFWVEYDRSESASESGKTIFVVHEFRCAMCAVRALVVDTVSSPKP